MRDAPALASALVLLLAGQGAGTSADTPTPGAAPSAPAFGSSITVVTVPVFVTDKRGAAVPGLTEDDFEVFDEGRPMRLVGVREFDAADAAGPGGETSPAARRHFLLLFDLSFSGVNGLVRAQKAALEFVTGGLGPTDLAAVATFTANHGVRLLVGFTSDRHQLRRAVATMGLTQPDQRADPLGLAFDLRELGAVAADTLPEERGDMVRDSIRAIQLRFERAQEALYRQRVLALLDGMHQLAASLDVVQGRKQVIYFSNGFDETALEGQKGQQQLQDNEAVTRGRLWEVPSDNRFGDAQVREEMRRMLQAFSSSDSLVHAVDLSGLTARGDARQQSSEPAQRSGHGSLSEMARLSGGRFFRNTNDPGVALGEIAELSRHYYLLAFEPQQARGPGRFHKLKVEVRGKDREVSHRSGYFERAPYAERPALARRFEAAEIITKGIEVDDIPLRVVGMPYRTAEGKVTLPFVLEADGEAVLRGAQGGRIALEIYGYALDAAGAVKDLVAFTSALDLSVAGPRLRARGLQCHATFTLGPGPHSLRFLVRDSASGRSGARGLDVTVPDFDPSEVLLFPPLFMDEPEQWLILQAPSRSTPHPVSPFLVAEEPFTPRARPSLANGRTDRVFLMAYDAGRAYDPGASFEIRPQLVAHDGAPVRLGHIEVVQAEAGADGFRRFVLQVTPDGLSAGDYTLRVRLREPGTGRISEAFQPVQVE
ncbi:MAG TPA: VWA domain-containing protein [Vicinamibacteria bacterium]|nr:VWA domain-containing protein [Vicinamibacteria bacterium]